MAKRIESSEIVQDDLLKNLRESEVSTRKEAELLVVQLNAVNSTLSDIKKNAATIKGGVLNLGKANTSDIDARIKAQTASNKLVKEAQTFEKEQQRLQKEYEKLVSDREKRLNKIADIEAKNHTKREAQYNKEIELAKKESQAYNAESKALNELRHRYRDLAIQKEKGIKLTKDEEKELRDLNYQIKQSDSALKRVDASMGQYQRSIGNYEKATNGLRNGLAQLGLSFGVFQLGSSLTKEVIGFENAIASFRTIVSDLNDNEFERYKSQIKSVADETKRSNTEIAQSFEVIAGLNSKFADTEKGLGDVSKATTTLADASRDSLENSASNLVGIMNQFDLAADQADRTANVLAAGQAVGASSITQSAEAYKNFGAVAKGANITLEQSQALIQVLGKNTIFGAEAGTKLRGVTLQLQKANLGYKSGIFNINDALEEFNARMAGKKTATEKDAYATKIFGAENITAGKIVSSNIPLFNEYTKAVTGTTEAQKAAEINTNTLSKRWEQFKDALSNAITSNSSANSSINQLKDGLKFLTENLNTVLKIVYQGARAWVIYKLAMKALDLNSSFEAWKRLGSGISSATSSLDSGANSARNFGNALKGIGFTAVISLAIELGNKIYRIVSGMELMEEHARIFENIFAKRARKDLDQFVKETEKSNSDRIESIRKLRKEGEISASEEAKRLSDSEKQRKKDFEDRIKQIRQQKDIVLFALKAERDAYKDDPNLKTKQAIIDLIAQERLLSSQIEILKQGTSDLNDIQNDNTDIIIEQGKASKKLNTELKEQNEYLSKQSELLYDINNLVRDSEIDKQTDRIEKLRQEALKQMELTGMPLGNIGKIKEAIDARAEMEKQAIEATLQYRLQQLNDAYLKETELARKAIDDNRTELLKQEGLTASEKIKIEQSYQEALKKLESDNLKRSEDLTLEIEKAKQESANAQVEIEKKKNDEIIDITKELNDKQEEFDQKRLDSSKKTDEDEDERRKKRIEDQRNLAKLLADYFIEQSNRRIAQIDKEQQAAENQFNYLQGLAQSGNINAKESLAEQQRLIREANLARQKELKMQERIKLAQTAYDTYQQKIESGDKTPLASTIRDLTLLQQFINSIPAFKDGGEHKGGLMLVNDAKGSNFREIIQTPDGNLSSPTGRNVVMDAPKGTKIFTQDQWAEANNRARQNDALLMGNSLGGNVGGNSFDILPVLKELKSLKKTIKDKPETTYSVEEVMSQMFTLSKQTKRGNTTIVDRFQFRKK